MKASNTNKEQLSRRPELWKWGKVNPLLRECIGIHKRLETSNSNNKKPKCISKAYVYFIKTGNINRALQLLSENPDNGVLSLTGEVNTFPATANFLHAFHAAANTI